MSNIIRTKTQGAFIEEICPLGKYFVKVEDPEGVDDNFVNNFELDKDFPKISSDIWEKVINLYLHAAAMGCEARVNFYFDGFEEEWHCFVPRQFVSAGSTDPIKDKNPDYLVDILTGDKYLKEEIPFDFLGTSHSHHAMTLDDFSAKDDADELELPGFHILFSSLSKANTYRITASIVRNYKRYYFEPDLIIKDLRASKNPLLKDKIKSKTFVLPKKIVTLHENVYTQIQKFVYPVYANSLPLGKSKFNTFFAPSRYQKSKETFWDFGDDYDRNYANTSHSDKVIQQYLEYLEMQGITPNDVFEYLLNNKDY